MGNFLFKDRVFPLIVLFVVKMVFAWDNFLNCIKMFQHRIFGGEGWGRIGHFFALTNMLLYFQITLPKSLVWVINISLILLLYILSFFPFESCFKLLLYIELSNSFLIGPKRTVNFRNQRP